MQTQAGNLIPRKRDHFASLPAKQATRVTHHPNSAISQKSQEQCDPPQRNPAHREHQDEFAFGDKPPIPNIEADPDQQDQQSPASASKIGTRGCSVQAQRLTEIQNRCRQFPGQFGMESGGSFGANQLGMVSLRPVRDDGGQQRSQIERLKIALRFRSRLTLSEQFRNVNLADR